MHLASLRFRSAQFDNERLTQRVKIATLKISVIMTPIKASKWEGIETNTPRALRPDFLTDRFLGLRLIASSPRFTDSFRLGRLICRGALLRC